MENPPPAHPHLALRHRSLWLMAGLVLAGRLLWFAYWGVLLEHDSMGYLEWQVGVYHPPGYNVFAGLVLGLVDHLEAVVVAQGMVYALAVALLLQQVTANARWRWVMALALALEPMSGKLACTLMSETLSLSLLLLACWLYAWVVGAAGRRWHLGMAAVGLVLGLAELTRHIAWVLVIGMALAWVLGQGGYLRKALGLLLLLLGFQLGVLPLRLYYWARFDTLAYNHFSQLSAWNSTAFLFPGSSQRTGPASSEFVRYLQSQPDSVFAMGETWHTNQIFNEHNPFQRFVAAGDPGRLLAHISEAGALAGQLRRAHWQRWCLEFVLPNVQRPFAGPERIHADRLPPLIRHPLHFQPHPIHDYQPAAIVVALAVLLLLLLHIPWERRRMGQLQWAVLLGMVLYLVGIATMTVLFQRFLYFLGPWVVLAAGLRYVDHFRTAGEPGAHQPMPSP